MDRETEKVIVLFISLVIFTFSVFFILVGYKNIDLSFNIVNFQRQGIINPKYNITDVSIGDKEMGIEMSYHVGCKLLFWGLIGFILSFLMLLSLVFTG